MTSVNQPLTDYSNENVENRVARVFISSTFKDMESEREYLMKHVFPQIRIYCKNRDVEFVPLDLRCGITLEQSESGRVAEICLREIKKSRPFFIGILGERYGWVPKPGEVTESSEFPFVEQDVADGLSITEMEIQFGVLRFPDKVDAAFWLRSPEMGTPNEHTEAPDTEPYHKLKELKGKIENSSYPHAEYLSKEDLGHQVDETLRSWIDGLFPENVKLTWLEKQNLQQRAFERSRSRLYVENDRDYRTLDNFVADSERRVLAVTGASGLGKSSLLVNWTARYGETHKDDAFVVAHYVSASDGSETPANILRRLTETLDPKSATSGDPRDAFDKAFQLDDASQEPKPLEDQTRELAAAVQKWRSRNAKKTLIVVLDGLNQLPDKDKAKELVWIPPLPTGVKLILSTINGDKTNDAISRRGWSRYEAKPLSQDQIARITTEFLNSRGRELTREQYSRIVSHEVMTNPMALRSLLDQLSSFGQYGEKGEALDAEIDRYLKASSIEELFDKIFDNLEMDEQGEKVRTLAAAVAASRYGMTENELLELTDYKQFDVSWFLCLLDAHLVNRSGYYSFSHEYIRAAIGRRSGDSLAKTREELISFFSKREKDAQRENDEQKVECRFKRSCQEIPFQLKELESWSRLYEFLLDLRVLDELYDETLTCDYCVYWNALRRTDEEEYSFQRLLKISDAGYSGSQRARLWFTVGRLTYDYRRFETAEKAYSKSLDIYRKLAKDNPDAYSSYVADTLNHLAGLYYNAGRFQDAEKEFEEVLEIRKQNAEEWPEASLLNLADSLNNLANLHFNVGRFQDAEKEYKEALEIKRKLAKDNPNAYLPRLADSLNNLAHLHYVIKRFKDAEKEYKEALEIRRKLAKDNPDAYLPDLATSLNNLASLHSDLNPFQNAEQEYTEALEIYRKLARDNPNSYLPHLALTLNNLGVLYEQTGRPQTAKNKRMEALEIKRNLAKGNLEAFLPSLTDSFNNLDAPDFDMKYFQDAEKGYADALEINRKLAMDNPNAYLPDLAQSLNNLANLHFNMGRFEDAEKGYEKALDIYRKLAKYNPDAYLPALATSLNNLANLRFNVGRFQDAEIGYMEALDIRRKLAEDNPDAYLPDHSQSLNNLANLRHSMGRFEDAEKGYMEALEIRRKLAMDNPDAYLPNLAMSLDNLALLHSDIKRFQDAEKEYTEALEIYRKLAEENPDAYLPDLAKTLIVLAFYVYSKTERYQEAEEALLEAIDIQRKFAATDSATHETSLAYSLNCLAEVYFKQARFREALTPQEESVAIFRKRVAPPYDSIASVWIEALTRLSEIHRNLGMTMEAEQERVEADSLRQKLEESDDGKAGG